MAKVYNIMDKLVNVKPILEIDENHKYKINNSKNNAVYIQSLFSNNKKNKGKDKEINEFEALDKIIKASLGEEAFDYIESLDLSLEGYNLIVNAIMAGISNVELEEIEEMGKKEMERFQEEEK
ncbi:hypothetical protein ACFO6R_10140 [Eubacterium multiforme]|uniref:Phage XkdN-like tail assembly chaperone protein, TAC n=1 Tax=Eubacterium multiforme TaxID=83339 RepID=A0ABT9UST8_9FIRM|nr:hypothetical protein [Eubacterium multiforme]MDQ0149356.1 hypothetical protein [Eubacterium multiforme]